jgi:hypothetical protein
MKTHIWLWEGELNEWKKFFSKIFSKIFSRYENAIWVEKEWMWVLKLLINMFYTRWRWQNYNFSFNFFNILVEMHRIFNIKTFHTSCCHWIIIFVMLTFVSGNFLLKFHLLNVIFDAVCMLMSRFRTINWKNDLFDKSQRRSFLVSSCTWPVTSVTN